jgi:WS/DGAT/MGAT family acyltransferase
MAEDLSPADRSSLNAEKGPINMAVAGVILLERGPGVTYQALCRRIEERIHLIPRYRQRLKESVTGIANPVWIDDEHFDVGWHVRQSTLPAPGGDAELAQFVGREASRRMDRSRPLWELHVIDGLVGDRVAVMPKMHHALVDGAAAVGVALLLLDPGPEPTEVQPPESEWVPQRSSQMRYLARAATRPLARSRRLALSATERFLYATPRTTAADVTKATKLVGALAAARPSAPLLPFNREISPNRTWGLTRTELAPIKAAAKAAGATINDVILAAVAGMVYRYVEAAGMDPAGFPRDGVALVPVNLRETSDDPGMGNRISVVFVDLPIGEPDVRKRIKLVNERMTAIKGSPTVAAGALMVDMSGFAPPLFSSILARAGGGGNFNLVVSNVPGPQAPLYLNGSLVLGVHPVVPLNPSDQGLNVGVFSYNGQVGFGVSADATLDPPVEVAVSALEAALAEAQA